MNSTIRTRGFLILLALIVGFLSFYWDQVGVVFAQDPSSPLTPTPFGLPPAAPPLPGLTPTTTPDLRVVNQIIQPKIGDAVFGNTPIVGTALLDDYLRYEMHISPSGAENWQWLVSSFAVVRNGLLYALDTTKYPDGFYDLRVRAIDAKGGYTESFVRGIEIRNANPPTPTPFSAGQVLTQPVVPLLTLAPSIATPTPTPLFRSNFANGQGIFAPQNGDILRGQVSIDGTVNSKSVANPFVRYELHIAASGGDDWGWLFSGDEQLWQSPLYTLDTTRLADGFYDLRLRTVYRDGNYDEYYVTRLRIANQGSALPAQSVDGAGSKSPGLFFPRDNTQVTGIVDFVGTSAAPDALRWELYWSPSGEDDWRFLVSDAKAITNSMLARLDLSLLPAGSYDFRLRIVRRDNSFADYDVSNVRVVPPAGQP